MKKAAVVYIHGKGGSADEAAHYKPLFPGYDVIGFDYRAQTPWEANGEFAAYFEALSATYEAIILIGSSIGAYFAMNAGIDAVIQKAYFISPIVDMEELIGRMMSWAHVTEGDLREKGVISTDFGEDLSWEYLSYVRAHPAKWSVPTEILYGKQDALTSLEAISAFAARHHARVTVMENGEHWFHTDEQMCFLDDWISNCERG